jgi:hypothetical protein
VLPLHCMHYESVKSFFPVVLLAFWSMLDFVISGLELFFYWFLLI